MLEERTLAIVLRNRPYGESDKIVTFLTKDWGKITGIAKGAQRSRRRFVNVLEPFTHLQLRFRPSRTDELAFIFGCDLLQQFRGPSRDLQCFAIASYICELVDVMVTGREAGQEIYTLLLNSLQILEETKSVSRTFLPTFELLLLAHTGYAPHLTDCQQCGRNTKATESPWVFSPSLGGLLCSQCRDQGGAVVVLSGDTIHFLAATKNHVIAEASSPSASLQISQELRALARSMLSRHLHRPLKSRAFLAEASFLEHDSVDVPPGE